MFRSARLIPISLNRGCASGVLPPPLPPRSIRPNIDRPNESRSRARAPCTYLLTCLRIVVSPPLRRSSFAHTYGGGREEKIHITLERNIYIYALIHVYQARPSLKRRRKPTTISREKDVSPVFLATRHSIFFFLTLSLSLSVSRASERASKRCEATRRARLIDRSASRREFSSGGKKKNERSLLD